MTISLFLGVYFEEGCAHKFLVWLKAWAGCTFVAVLVVVAIEVFKNQALTGQMPCMDLFSDSTRGMDETAF